MLVVLLCESTELAAQALTEESETVGRHDVWFEGERICGMMEAESMDCLCIAN